MEHPVNEFVCDFCVIMPFDQIFFRFFIYRRSYFECDKMLTMY